MAKIELTPELEQAVRDTATVGVLRASDMLGVDKQVLWRWRHELGVKIMQRGGNMKYPYTTEFAATFKQWRKEGKTYAQIAIIMGIPSKYYVSQYVKRMQARGLL